MARSYEEIINSLPEDEREVVTKAQHAISDKRVQDGIETYRRNHPVPDEKGTLQRLEKLEAAHRAAVEAADLRFAVFRECHEAAVDYSLVENVPFASQEAARAWIRKLGEAHKELTAEAEKKARNELLAGGFKPGSGNGPGGGVDLKRLSPDEALALEQSGRLNAMLSRH